MTILDLLFIRWNVSPYLLHIGHFVLRWYGILFITGFILGYWMFTKIYKAEALPLKLLDPMLYMLLICALVGARLGHIIFYEPHYYFVEHPEEILKVWH
ncbi:MAG: prolipoprotein diacylglyceryl transferase, partial [Bacteroidales bacterium]|nr:prolipoprotein diacylglyceryl transferase [Bacteroidales bacterium]